MRAPALTTLLPLVSGIALGAAETPFVGPAAAGMGGSSVAIADDALAQYHNPAFLGFMGHSADPDAEEPPSVDRRRLSQRRTSLNLVDGTVGVQVLGELGELANQLADLDVDRLGTLNDLTEQDVRDLSNLASALGSIGDDDNLVLLDGNAGAGLQIGSFAIGVRAFGMAQGFVDEVDLSNLGLDFVDGTALGNEIADAGAADGDFATDGTLTVLGGGQATDLSDSLGNNNDAVEYIDFQLQQLLDDGIINDDQIDAAVETLVAAADLTGSGGSLEDNTTKVVASGIGLFEIPVSYGYAFDDRLSIGVTGKLMIGRVYGGAVRVFDEDVDQAFDESFDDSEQSVSVSVDIGIAYRIGQFQFGARGSNLTAPEFDGFDNEVDVNGNGVIEPKERFTVPDVEIDPQVTIGAAWIPWSNLVLTAEGDLLQAGTVSSSYDVQHIRAGLEWDALDVLALRAGAYRNIAESAAPLVVTGGVGIDLWAVQIDLHGAVSPGDTAEIDGDEYPEVARVGLGIKSFF